VVSAGAGSARLCVVLCNAPPDQAEPIARALVERRLAACVNVIPAVTSLYFWEGELTRDAEATLLAKTRAELVPALTDAIRELHPYEVPEVIALPIEPGLGNLAYHAWVARETTPRA
jgi:periplasmic divalent cation tolerance protein